MRPAPALRLFLLGFLTLFLELVLIRYLAGTIWNLGYFPNLVLLGVFVGMGTGFVCHHLFSERVSRAIFAGVAPGLLGLIVVVRLWRPAVPGFDEWGGEVGREIFFTAAPATSSLGDHLAFLIWLFAVIALFAMISQATAKLFARFRPLTAYTLDIAGSCAGIVTFTLLSWQQLPAGVWMLVLAPLFVFTVSPLSRHSVTLAVGACALAAAVVTQQDATLLADPGQAAVAVWSPYQKVEYAEGAGRSPIVYVNGIRHQQIHEAKIIARTFYTQPYRLRAQQSDADPYRRVLVIGAGSGNDVTAGLLSGVEHIDAVEIDPVIAAVAREHHPARPYQDPRVQLTIGDGRAFLTNAKERYDLIVFALTDSLVKVSPMAQLRLENFLFTRESIQRAYELLRPGGTLVLYNFYRRPWLLEKLSTTLRVATGEEPRMLFQAGDFAMLGVDRASVPPPRDGSPSMAIATDDWPFPYLRDRRIPSVYVAGMGLLVLYVALLFAWVQRRGRGASDSAAPPGVSAPLKLAFAFMGIAFMLLETKSIIQFSLLFGTTWLNNAMVFLGILLLVLAANWVATAIGGRWFLWGTFAALIASSLLTLGVPLSTLLDVESLGWRFVGATLLTFSPIFFANLLFSVSFREQRVAEHLFGWNLLGATLGGVIEYGSMAVGYTALIWVVAACYTVAFALLVGAGRPVVSAERPH